MGLSENQPDVKTELSLMAAMLRLLLALRAVVEEQKATWPMWRNSL